MLGETSVPLWATRLSPDGGTGVFTSTRMAFAGGAVICSSGFLFVPAATWLFAFGRDMLGVLVVASGFCNARDVLALVLALVEAFCAGAWFCLGPPMEPRREVKDVMTAELAQRPH